MKAEKKLKLSIEALDNFGVSPEIIKDMLNDLNQVLLDKKSEKIAKDHFRKQRDNGLIELKDYTKDLACEFAEWVRVKGYKPDGERTWTRKIAGKPLEIKTTNNYSPNS